MPDAVSFDVSGVSVYGDHITVRIGSASGLHEIAVHETGSGTPLGAYTVTPSVPATTAVVPLSPVPHSTSLTITITALGSTPGALDTITFYLPRDTTVPTNIASNVCTGGGYRYGYNTQIKENEIAGIGNHYSALYWEYDPRVARRWNVDPQRKIWESPYSVLGGNPILLNDVLGNTWTVSTDDNTKNDVNNIIEKKKNRDYISIDNNGSVTMSEKFTQLEKEKQEKILKNDPGLKLVNDLVGASEKYYYSTTPEFYSRGFKESKNEFIANGGIEEIYNGVENGYLNDFWQSPIYVKNASLTTYGFDSYGKMVPTLLPREGYDGQVGIAAGILRFVKENEVTDPNTGVTKKVITSIEVRNRAVRHELYESYLRTTEKLPYLKAHNLSSSKFGGNFEGGHLILGE